MKHYEYGLVGSDVLDDDARAAGESLVTGHLNDILEILKRAEVRAKQVKKDNGLKQFRQVEELKKVCDATVSELERKSLPRVKEAEKRLTAVISRQQLPTRKEAIAAGASERVLERLEEKIASMDPVKQQEVLFQAVERGDIPVIAACQGSHVELLPGCNPKVLEEVRKRWVESGIPKGDATIRAHLQSNHNRAVGAVKKMTEL